MSDNVHAATDATFEATVLNSDIPVLVDFWATWCMPCKAIAPHLDTLAAENTGKLKVVKVDIQKNPKTPNQFGVRNIPTLLIFKGGKVVGQQVGVNGGLPGLRNFVSTNI